jgi:predicted dehydrogenase
VITPGILGARRGPVGVGIIGAGVISTQYLESLTSAADVRVAMVADLDVERAAARAAAFAVPRSGTADELLKRDDIDIVVNLTIPAVHAEIGRAAIGAGKHVFSEKPFALDPADGTALLEAGAAAGLRTACAPDTVLGAGLQTGLRMIRDGAIGTPLTGLSLFQAAGPESWHPNPEFLFAVGGGPLFDMGPYYLTTLLSVFGPVSSVVAAGSTSQRERVIGSGPRAGTVFPVEVPTHVGGLLSFASGASVQAIFSFESPRERVGVVEITGTEGALSFPDPNLHDGPVELWRPGATVPETFPAEGSTMGRGHGVVELARAIRSGRPERTTGELALHVLEVMSALQSSATTGGGARETRTTFDVPPLLPPDWDPRAATL